MSTPNWYTPPARVSGPSGPPPRPVEGAAHAEYAGFAVRGGARVIDMIAGFLVSAVAGFAAGIVLAMLQMAHVIDRGWPARMGGISWAGFVVGMVAALLYHTLAEWIGGATLGKLCLGLRVRSVDLSPCTLRGALLRELAFYVDGLFFGVVAFRSMSGSETKQRLGDKWGRAVVVRAASLQAPPPAGRLAIGVVLGVLSSFAATFAQLVTVGM